MQLKSKLLSIANQALNIALPNRCFGCKTITVDLFCNNCIDQLAMPASISFEIGNGKILKIYSALPYTDLSQGLIHAKFTWRPGAFARAAKILIDRIGYQEGLVCHIPAHWSRQMVRGFDQAKILAHNYADKTHQVHIPLLKRTRATEKQSIQVGAAKREANVKNAFELNKSILADDDGQHLTQRLSQPNSQIILIDDLLTTGSTMVWASKAIIAKFGNINTITGICLARTP